MSRADNSRPGFWRRLGLAFIGFLRFLLFVALIVAIVAGVWIGYRELRRSIAAADDLAEINARNMALLRNDVENLAEDAAQKEDVSALEGRVQALESQVEALDTDLGEHLALQSETLTEMQEQLDSLSTRTAAQAEDLAALQDGVTALQEDVNANSRIADELGGDVDRLAATVTELEDGFAQVREDAGELAEMQRALTLLRVWELLARARLRLVQGNAGLAADDVSAALATIDGLLAESEEEDTTLADLQQRLTLTLDSLPADPTAAARDLETAWEIVDGQIVTLVGIPGAGPEATGPQPTATPSPTPTAAPPPTPTATPTPGS